MSQKGLKPSSDLFLKLACYLSGQAANLTMVVLEREM
jgi:hypothetical protein